MSLINIEDEALEDIQLIDCNSRFELTEWVSKYAFQLIHEIQYLRERGMK